MAVKKKSNKLLTIFLLILGFLGLLLILAGPILKVINPERKFVESVVKSCSAECGSDASNKCILSCLEKNGTIERGNVCSSVCQKTTNLTQCLLDNCIPSTSNANKWITFNSSVQSYSIDFPDQPGTTTQQINFEDKQLSATETSHGINTKNGSLIVTSLEIPNGYSEIEQQNILESMPKVMSSREGSKLVTMNNIDFKSNKAIEYEILTPKGYVKYISFIINYNLYTLGVLSPTNEFPDFDRFINSFQYKGE